MMYLNEMQLNMVNDAREDLLRAYECWRAWHNSMSRRWFRDCLLEYRMACLVADLT